MKIEVGNWYRVVGDCWIKEDVYECCQECEKGAYFWINGMRSYVENKHILPCTELEHAYPGAEIETTHYKYKILLISSFGVVLSLPEDFIKAGNFITIQQLKNLKAKLIPQTPLPDTKAEEQVTKILGYTIPKLRKVINFAISRGFNIHED